MTQVLMIAAEASSMLYAQRLLEHWKNAGRDIKAFGVGSQGMESLGFERMGKSEDMAVMGVAEIAKHYSHIKSVFHQVLDEVKKRKPKVAILMDYPGFNLRLAKELHALGVPVIYYISPQVWAWRQGRVHTMKKYCQKVLLLFPFEVEFYKRFQVPYEFVGHPLLDELDEKLLEPEFRKTHRNQCGINDGEFVLGLMPGSRRSELEKTFQIQLQTARLLSRRHPHLKILIMVAPSFEKEDLLPYLEDFRLPFVLMKDEPFRMIHLTDLVLATSGTATLMVGLLEKPMVIMYRMNWLTALIARMVVRGFFGLVNLILGHEAVPERFQGQATPEKLASLLDRYMTDTSYYEKTRSELAQLRHRLGEKDVTPRVARVVEEYF